MNQTLANGSTRYFWITTDIAAGATIGNTIIASALTTADITLTAGNKLGSASVGGTQTIASSVTLGSSNPAVSSDLYCKNTTKKPLYRYTLAAASGDATLEQLDFTTAGTYAAADVSKFQLWYSTSDDISTAAQIGSDIVASLGTGSHSFTGLSQTIASGATRYFWITTDIPAGATSSATISVDALTTSDLTFTASEEAGSASASGTFTIDGTATATNNGPVAIGGTLTLDVNPAGDSYSWTGPNGFTSTAKNPTVSASVTNAMDGVYSVTVTYAGGCSKVANTTVVIPADIALSSFSNNSGIGAIVTRGSTNNRLYNFTLTATTASTTLTELDFITAGTYVASDIDNFKLWISTSNIWPSTHQSTLTTTLDPGSHTFTGLNYAITEGQTYYVWITTDIDAAAVDNHTISTTAISTVDLTFAAANLSGTAAAGPVLTIDDNPGSCSAMPAQPACAGTNLVNSDNVSSDRQTVAGSTYTAISFTGGNIHICSGTVTIGFSGWSGGAIYVHEGATFNTNMSTIPSGASLYNYGTTNFTAGALLNSSTAFMNASGGIITFTGNLTGNSATLVNYGILSVSGTLGPWQNGGGICMGNASTASTGSISWDGISPTMRTPVGYSCVSYTGSASSANNHTFSNTVGTNVCQAAAAGNESGNGSWGSSSLIQDCPSCSALLPIQLSKFEAQQFTSNSIINWTTASEKNNDFFTIEISTNGIEWNTIYTCKGAGNSSSDKHYSFTDYNPYTSTVYYRLKQTDFDGTTSHSNIISVHQNGLKDIDILYTVNRTKNTLDILSPNIQISDIEQIEMYNLGGALVFKTNNISHSINLPNLPKGLYHIKTKLPMVSKVTTITIN
jgi:hypothetical protein